MKIIALVLAMAFAAPLLAHADPSVAHGINGGASAPAYQAEAGNGG